MFQMMARGYKFALALAMTIFSTIKTKFFNLRSSFYNSAKMDGFRRSRKYLSIVDLARTPTRLYLNKIDSRCLRWATYSNTDSYWYWEKRLNWLKMLLANAQLLPRFFQKKFWNSIYVISFLALQ